MSVGIKGIHYVVESSSQPLIPVLLLFDYDYVLLVWRLLGRRSRSLRSIPVARRYLCDIPAINIIKGKNDIEWYLLTLTYSLEEENIDAKYVSSRRYY